MKPLLTMVLFLALACPVYSQMSVPIVEKLTESLDRLLPDDQSGPGKAIRQTLNALAGKKDLRPAGTLIVQLGSFTFEDSNLESPLSPFLKDQVAFALVNSKSFSLAVPVQDQGPSPAADSGGDPRGIVSAKFYRKDDTLLVDFFLSDLTRGRVVGTDQVEIPLSLLPGSRAIEPKTAALSIAGFWKWTTGPSTNLGTVSFYPDGTMVRVSGNSVLDRGIWRVTDPSTRTVQLSWISGFVDSMVVENDTMRGQNASGNSVVGTRLD